MSENKQKEREISQWRLLLARNYWRATDDVLVLVVNLRFWWKINHQYFFVETLKLVSNFFILLEYLREQLKCKNNLKSQNLLSRSEEDLRLNYWLNSWNILISKGTSGFTSNTLLIRFPIMLSVYIVYRYPAVVAWR